MPKLTEILKLIDSQKTPYLRIYNMNRERLFVIECKDDLESAKHQLETMLPMFNSYGKLIIEAANETIKTRSYAGSFKWTLECEPKGTVVAGAQAATPGEIPKGYMHQDVVSAQLALINAKFDHDKELRKLEDQIKENNIQDPLKVIEKVAPVFLYMMGKDPIEIAKISGLYQNRSGIAGPQKDTHTLVFRDVENLSTAEKHTKLQNGLDELAKHASLEHTILLVNGLIKKLDPAQGGDPQFINTILSFL